MNGKILVVEDEESLREVIIDLLSESGLDPMAVNNGQLALNLMTSEAGRDVVCILSDIKMPVLDGLKMIRQLRESGIEVPVIFLSAFGDKEKAVEALKWGAYDFHDKPFQRDKLIHSITAAAELGRKLKSIESQIDDFLNLTKAIAQESQDVSTKRDHLKSLILEKVGFDLRYKNNKKAG